MQNKKKPALTSRYAPAITLFFSIICLICLSLCSILLSGCATTTITKSSSPMLSWGERSNKLKNISRWDLSGVFSIAHGHKTDIAAFTWQQDKQHFFIEIHGPLNLTSVKIVGKPGEVYLYRSFDKAIRATSPEALIEQQTRWILPISSLTFWIRNLPAPQAHHLNMPLATFDRYHHLQTLNQQNWQINYLSFVLVDDIELPKELELFTIQNNALTQQPEPLKIKMVIKSWSLSPPPLP